MNDILGSNSAITKSEIIELLNIKEEVKFNELLKRARDIREIHFGNKVFIYGFVYFSTYCKNNCSFCYYRNSNDILRYRKTEEEIVKHSVMLAKSGVSLIDLTMGEDEEYSSQDSDSISKIISRIKEATGLPLMISPGLVSETAIEKFSKSGADFYALYQETFNRELFKKLRINQSYDERMNAKASAKKYGMLVEEGILTGVSESLEDIANSILEMGNTSAEQLRVMTFVPQEGIPLKRQKFADNLMEEKIIAIIRIAYPKVLIPASLDIEGIGGLRRRMLSGANVVTSIIPPSTGYQGVAQSTMDVEEGGRTVDEVNAILKDLGMEQGSNEAFSELIREYKNKA